MLLSQDQSHTFMRHCDILTKTHPFPTITTQDYLKQAADDIIYILLHPPQSSFPSLQAGDPVRAALQELATQLKQVETLPPKLPLNESTTPFLPSTQQGQDTASLRVENIVPPRVEPRERTSNDATPTRVSTPPATQPPQQASVVPPNPSPPVPELRTNLTSSMQDLQQQSCAAKALRFAHQPTHKYSLRSTQHKVPPAYIARRHHNSRLGSRYQLAAQYLASSNIL